MKLEFLSNEADEDEGLGHAGIETYKDEPYASTARECGQNSSDAGRELPVIINFDRVAIPRTDLVADAELSAAIASGLEKANRDNDEKSIDFFQRGTDLMSRPEITVLRIADFNTNGLRGPSEPGNPFHSLVKATGISNKEKDTSGGSFGIGKNAVFAISELQTVFYATVYEDEQGNEQFLMQGKSILVSHVDAGGKPRRATGYWGAPGYAPVSDRDAVPEWLRREKMGTSIYAMGFRDADDWQHRMAASLLRNFFVAIHRGKMQFSLGDGSIKIDSDTLPGLFWDPKILDAADRSSQRDDFVYARCLYECLTSEESKEKFLDIPGLGRVLVKILIRDDLPKRLSIIRNGMIITDSLEKFGDKFASFPMYRDFVAFVEPREDKGSAQIKRLENPRHDGLSAERISDETKRRAATSTMQSLAKAVRGAIREETLSRPEEVQALDELATFFADADELKRIPNANTEEDPENYTYEPKPSPPKKPVIEEIQGLEGDHGDGEGDRGTVPRRVLDLANVRNVIGDSGSDQRTVWFTPGQSGLAILRVMASGMNYSDAIDVSATSSGSVSSGEVVVEVVAGERQRLELTLADGYDGPIELVGSTSEEGAARAD